MNLLGYLDEVDLLDWLLPVKTFSNPITRQDWQAHSTSSADEENRLIRRAGIH
jgi:hypothetical protein